MSKMLASLDRLEAELGAASENENSSANEFSLDRSGSRNHSMTEASGNGTLSGSKVDYKVAAKKSRRDIFCLRVFVIFALLSAAAAVGAAVFVTTKNGETRSFEIGFRNSARQIFDYFKFNVERKLAALDNFGLEMTSFAINTESVFPNVTMPDFAYRAEQFLGISESSHLVYLPAVTHAQRAGWEEYASNNGYWIEEATQHFMAAAAFSQERKLQDGRARPIRDEPVGEVVDFTNGVSKDIYAPALNGQPFIQEQFPLHFPIWQSYPADPSLVNYDLFSGFDFTDDIDATAKSRLVVFGKQWDLLNAEDAWTQNLRPKLEAIGLDTTTPVSRIYKPVFDKMGFGEQDRKLVGINIAMVNTHQLFTDGSGGVGKGVYVVLKNMCGQSHTFFIKDEHTEYIGIGDLHDPEYANMKRERTLNNIFNENAQYVRRFSGTALASDYCPFSMALYPSEEFEERFLSNNAFVYIMGVVAIFTFTIIMFLAYDYIQTKRQTQVMKQAAQARAIVSSLFPAAVRERLFRTGDNGSGQDTDPKDLRFGRGFFGDKGGTGKGQAMELKPIADLFPQTTVMFADIAGFTKWSSDRDPTEVFSMLQILYGAFDKIAKKRKVFKVETIGDCYVAVTGLPEPQADHALRMAKFANECRTKFTQHIEQLKLTFGEETGELMMRFGLHSGPVTAGVLLGEKSRFQLFGNTVNTAATMEHTGRPNKIQISSETADLITAAGKGHWIFNRVDDVAERGGIQTFWVEPQTSAQEARNNHSTVDRVQVTANTAADNNDRLIGWNTDLLKQLLKSLVAYRQDTKIPKEPLNEIIEDYNPPEEFTARDEITYSIQLPKFNRDRARTRASSIKLGKEVEEQLHHFVSLIASLYHNHPFHNFKHASNVCTNANKLMKSITDDEIYQRTSDPLTNFAVVFSALIHDVDHIGVPNSVLVKERPRLAAMYKNKSCAEQNSVDLAWNLLMDSDFTNLQETIFHTKEEYSRFRKIVVNVVMSTDIFDMDLNGDRDERWAKAFGQPSDEENMSDEELGNLRATVALECAMQMSDIMHTTQHFNSYCRWNERLFEEMYRAYHSGRSKMDPAVNWYQGEIWFFDNIVLPMARKIEGTRVFGVSGSDCLRNAFDNRKEWAMKGGHMVLESLDKILKTLEDEDRKESKQAISMGTDSPAMPVNDTSEREQAANPPAPAVDMHLIDWNLDLFKRLLRQILAQRMNRGDVDDHSECLPTFKKCRSARDEQTKWVAFRRSDSIDGVAKVDQNSIELSQVVEEQLKKFLLTIAGMYKGHPFHNFKHASNVATASNRFLNRINKEHIKKLTFEPLTHFAIIFSALIHDVDHPGSPNDLLVAENHELALKYSNKSVAEQNSVDVAWEVLMNEDYEELRNAIYHNKEESKRFRQLVVNCVMATDLFDSELIEDRLVRWNQAFGETSIDLELPEADFECLRATVVLEHILMASDVGHTMQHWHSFKRWNERFYFESYDLFKKGRLALDPTPNWYTNEIKFFDEVVIPIARRLNDSGVFGAAGEEAVRSATMNRKEWVIQGGAIVEGLKKRYEEYKKGNIA